MRPRRSHDTNRHRANRNTPVTSLEADSQAPGPAGGVRPEDVLPRDRAGKGDQAVNFTRSAAAIGTAVVLAGAAAGCGSSGSAPAASAAPAKLVVWRMGPSVGSQVTWMNGVVRQFHKQFPAYKNTKVVVN